jgi:hypothetical protein
MLFPKRGVLRLEGTNTLAKRSSLGNKPLDEMVEGRFGPPPFWRQISPTGVPLLACLKANATCSSLNRFFGIWHILRFRTCARIFASVWTSPRGEDPALAGRSGHALGLPPPRLSSSPGLGVCQRDQMSSQCQPLHLVWRVSIALPCSALHGRSSGCSSSENSRSSSSSGLALRPAVSGTRGVGRT